MKKTLAFFLIIICVFTACQKAPNRVDVDYHNLNQDSDKVELVYLSVSDAINEAKTIVGTVYKNIDLQGKYYLPSVDKVYSARHSLKPYDEDELLRTIKNVWNNYERVDSESYEINKGVYDKIIKDDVEDIHYWIKTGYSKDISGSKIESYEMDACGFMAGFDGDPRCYDTFDECVASYDLMWGDVVDDTVGYDLEDGFYTINDAVQDVEEIFNAKFNEIEKNQFSYKVSAINVMKKRDKDSCCYVMVISRCYKNINIDIVDFFYNENDSIECFPITLTGKFIDSAMRFKGEINSFTNQGFALNVIGSNEEEKIISMKTAMDLAINKYSLGSFKAEKYGLVYLLSSENKGFINNTTEMLDFDEVKIRPYWIFVNKLETNMDDCLRLGFNFKYNNTVLVDAISGECFYFSTTV